MTSSETTEAAETGCKMSVELQMGRHRVNGPPPTQEVLAPVQAQNTRCFGCGAFSQPTATCTRCGARNGRETARSALERRFWDKVRKTDLCWIWTAGTSRDSYGEFATPSCKHVAAHRFSYELTFGPIPAGLHLDHLCRNTLCVNPDHLEAVTCRENLMRGDTIAARNSRKTHCKHGHEFTEANTSQPPSGGRHCRTCERERKRRLARDSE